MDSSPLRTHRSWGLLVLSHQKDVDADSFSSSVAWAAHDTFWSLRCDWLSLEQKLEGPTWEFFFNNFDDIYREMRNKKNMYTWGATDLESAREE